MTDKTPNIADKVREILANRGLGAAEMIAEIESILPPRPTLADMTMPERRSCQWMQADADHRRAVILVTDLSGERVALLDRWGDVIYVDHEDVTPRPDLPRMGWPGTEKPAPALPEGWRFADHPHYGRVIVTRTEPDLDGEVAITVPVPTNADRARLEWCRPDELTYIDADQ